MKFWAWSVIWAVCDPFFTYHVYGEMISVSWRLSCHRTTNFLYSILGDSGLGFVVVVWFFGRVSFMQIVELCFAEPLFVLTHSSSSLARRTFLYTPCSTQLHGWIVCFTRSAGWPNTQLWFPKHHGCGMSHVENKQITQFSG